MEERINAELDKLTPTETFLRYYGGSLAARREVANGHVPPDDDVPWMKRELFETMLADERRRHAA